MLIIFILIPTAYAADIDDSIYSSDLAVDDSTDLMVDDGACIQDDSSSNNLKSASQKSVINQDENSIAQDELLEDSDDDPEDDPEDNPDENEEDDSEGEEDESDDDPDEDDEDDSDGEEDESDDGPEEDEEDDSEDDEDESDSEDDEDDNEFLDYEFDDGEYEKYLSGASSGFSYTKDPYLYYSYLPQIYSDLNLAISRSPKTILDPNVEQSFAVFISARFLDNDGNPLKDTEVILLVNYEEYRTKTDSDGVAIWDLMLSGDYFFAMINPVTGECYIFPELMHVSFYSNATTGFRHNGNTHMFTVNSNGIKSTIKNEKGIVSKAITFSKDKVIISTKTNDSIDQIVLDRFTRYSIYLLAILCIVLPIGILRYRKK